MNVTNCTEPLTWAITSGILPPGLSLDPDTGEVSGDPTTPGTYPFTLEVTDINGCYDAHDITIVIDDIGDQKPFLYQGKILVNSSGHVILGGRNCCCWPNYNCECRSCFTADELADIYPATVSVTLPSWGCSANCYIGPCSDEAGTYTLAQSDTEWVAHQQQPLFHGSSGIDDDPGTVGQVTVALYCVPNSSPVVWELHVVSNDMYNSATPREPIGANTYYRKTGGGSYPDVTGNYTLSLDQSDEFQCTKVPETLTVYS